MTQRCMLSGPWQALAEQLAVLPRHIKVWRRTWTEEEWNERMASVLTELVGEVLDGGFPRASARLSEVKALLLPSNERIAELLACLQECEDEDQHFREGADELAGGLLLEVSNRLRTLAIGAAPSATEELFDHLWEEAHLKLPEAQRSEVVTKWARDTEIVLSLALHAHLTPEATQRYEALSSSDGVTAERLEEFMQAELPDFEPICNGVLEEQAQQFLLELHSLETETDAFVEQCGERILDEAAPLISAALKEVTSHPVAPTRRQQGCKTLMEWMDRDLAQRMGNESSRASAVDIKIVSDSIWHVFRGEPADSEADHA